MDGPYISRVKIKNFRNFKDIDVPLAHKQVIIGENNAGKTNFLRALQLILDPTLSDRDRQLTKLDFHDSLDKPMENGEKIEITIELIGYENSRQLLSMLSDASVSDNPPTIRITYKYEPFRDESQKIIGYHYNIYLGETDLRFTSNHRNYLNITVVKALRDVEREMKGLQRSPLYRLVEDLSILDDELNEIAEELKSASISVLKLDEIVHIKELLQDKFTLLSGTQPDCGIDLSTFDIEPSRLLHTLQVLLGASKRPVSEVSLGLCNILYIAVMLLLIRDRTIPALVKEKDWDRIRENDSDGILETFYEKGNRKNYLLREGSSDMQNYSALYDFMNKHLTRSQGFTILAIEEPEAHLHPVLQRVIYKEVLQKSSTSVIFSTHSTHITSVAPIESIVHIRTNNEKVSSVMSTAQLALKPEERKDVERYLDAKKSELFFGTGVVLVEGTVEEYLVPHFADIMGHPLELNRIVVCSVDSTNFKPYVQLLEALGIRWCIITDGDFYEIIDGKKKYHRMSTDEDEFGYRGHELIKSMLIELGIATEEEVTDDFAGQEATFNDLGCFVGEYTLEVDIMSQSTPSGRNIIKEVFKGINPKSKKFPSALDSGDYWKALNIIENSCGKGRFAQRLISVSSQELIPQHISLAIQYIVTKIQGRNE